MRETLAELMPALITPEERSRSFSSYPVPKQELGNEGNILRFGLVHSPFSGIIFNSEGRNVAGFKQARHGPSPKITILKKEQTSTGR
jgi:hypothetical protein